MKKAILFCFFCLHLFNLKTIAQSQFKQFLTPYLNPIEQTLLSSDEIIIAGSHSLKNTGIVIAKYNPCGTAIWSKKIAKKNENLRLVDLKVDSRDNILIAGNLNSKNKERKVFVMSVSPKGNLNFFKEMNTDTEDILYAIDVNAKNEIYLFFKTKLEEIGPHNENTLAKLDSNGNALWIKQYGFTYVWGQMCNSSNGGVLISDTRQIVKIDRLGNVEWHKTFEKSYYSQDHFEIPGGYVFFRYSTSSTSNQSYAMMLNEDGSLKWNSQRLPNFRPHKGILRKNGKLLFVGDLAIQATTNNLTFIEIDTANGSILGTYLQKENPPLTLAFDLNQLTDSSIVYSGNEGFTLVGQSFIGRVNKTLNRVNCKDSVLNFNFPRDSNGVATPTKPWSGQKITIQIVEPSIQVDTFTLLGNSKFCQYSHPLSLNLGKDTTICPDSLFTIGASADYDGYLWSNGKTTKQITIEEAGTYWLTAWIECDTISDSIQVNYHQLPKISLGTDTSICRDDSLTLYSNDTTAFWSTGDTAKNITVQQAGTYWAKIPSICGYLSDTIVVDHYPKLKKPQLGKDTSICYYDSIRLAVDADNNQLLWSTGATEERIVVRSPGTYHVKVMNVCDTVRDSIQVSHHPKTKLDFSVSKYRAKVLDSIIFNLISPTNYNKLLWQFGNGESSNKRATFQTYRTSGLKQLKLLLTDSLSCRYDSTFNIEIKKLPFRIPNIFSPNGDGINDKFKILADGIEAMELKIFNRWGELIFQSQEAAWDGKGANGNKAPTAVYFYTLTFKQVGNAEKSISGAVELVR